MWVQALGHSPDMPSKHKNVLGYIGIPLKGVPQVPGNKPNPTQVG